MPFAVFVGVNHHSQSTLLGCALLSNEFKESFEWCFKTLLHCMNNVHPDAIITDQCGSICGAVSDVLPDTRHRWCLWHVLKKLPEKLGGIANKEQVCCLFQHDVTKKHQNTPSNLQIQVSVITSQTRCNESTGCIP